MRSSEQVTGHARKGRQPGAAGRRVPRGIHLAFYTELNGLALAKREAERWPFSFGRLERRLRRLSLHLLDAQELMSRLSALSKMNAHLSFINALRDEGRARAEAWLEANFSRIGARSSFNLRALLP